MPRSTSGATLGFVLYACATRQSFHLGTRAATRARALTRPAGSAPRRAALCGRGAHTPGLYRRADCSGGTGRATVAPAAGEPGARAKQMMEPSGSDFMPPNAQVQGRPLGMAEACGGGGIPCNAQLGLLQTRKRMSSRGLVAAMLLYDSFSRCRELGQLGCGASRAGNKFATAVRAHASERCLRAGRTERAFE